MQSRLTSIIGFVDQAHKKSRFYMTSRLHKSRFVLGSLHDEFVLQVGSSNSGSAFDGFRRTNSAKNEWVSEGFGLTPAHHKRHSYQPHCPKWNY